MLPWKFRVSWARFWMQFAGMNPFGRAATKLAILTMPPYHGKRDMAAMNAKGFISPSASIYGEEIQLGNNIYIDDHVVLYGPHKDGEIVLGDKVTLLRGTILQLGIGGSITIGKQTTIQPFCQFSAYKSSIYIGKRVQIAPRCSFYPYNHGVDLGIPINDQPLTSKGNIRIGDESWLGVGVTVLDGVSIGAGAVIGAGSLVTTDIPENAIAAGSPAKVLKMRTMPDS